MLEVDKCELFWSLDSNLYHIVSVQILPFKNVNKLGTNKCGSQDTSLVFIPQSQCNIVGLSFLSCLLITELQMITFSFC